MRQNIYDVFTKDGNPVLLSATMKDIEEKIGCTRSQVYNAVNYGYAMQGKYTVKLVDQTLTQNKDMGLLIEFDMARKEILEAGRRRNERRCTNDF